MFELVVDLAITCLALSAIPEFELFPHPAIVRIPRATENKPINPKDFVLTLRFTFIELKSKDRCLRL